MPRVKPTVIQRIREKETQVDKFPLLKQYDPTWDLTNVTVIHKLYVGSRTTYDSEMRVINRERITQWGPHKFECQGCGKSRMTYELIAKHQEVCKKLI